MCLIYLIDILSEMHCVRWIAYGHSCVQQIKISKCRSFSRDNHDSSTAINKTPARRTPTSRILCPRRLPMLQLLSNSSRLLFLGLFPPATKLVHNRRHPSPFFPVVFVY